MHQICPVAIIQAFRKHDFDRRTIMALREKVTEAMLLRNPIPADKVFDKKHPYHYKDFQDNLFAKDFAAGVVMPQAKKEYLKRYFA
jgi:hypothetical protein